MTYHEPLLDLVAAQPAQAGEEEGSFVVQGGGGGVLLEPEVMAGWRVAVSGVQSRGQVLRKPPVQHDLESLREHGGVYIRPDEGRAKCWYQYRLWTVGVLWMGQKVRGACCVRTWVWVHAARRGTQGAITRAQLCVCVCVSGCQGRGARNINK